jgi:hypothetical protein
MLKIYKGSEDLQEVMVINRSTGTEPDTVFIYLKRFKTQKSGPGAACVGSAVG